MPRGMRSSPIEKCSRLRCGLRAPVMLGRHLDRAHRVRLGRACRSGPCRSAHPATHASRPPSSPPFCNIRPPSGIGHNAPRQAAIAGHGSGSRERIPHDRSLSADRRRRPAVRARAAIWQASCRPGRTRGSGITARSSRGCSLRRRGSRRWCASYLPIIAGFDEDYIEEMRGIAAGAEVPFEDIVLLNARTEILKLAERPDLRASLLPAGWLHRGRRHAAGDRGWAADPCAELGLEGRMRRDRGGAAHPARGRAGHPDLHRGRRAGALRLQLRRASPSRRTTCNRTATTARWACRWR